MFMWSYLSEWRKDTSFSSSQKFFEACVHLRFAFALCNTIDLLLWVLKGSTHAKTIVQKIAEDLSVCENAFF